MLTQLRTALAQRPIIERAALTIAPGKEQMLREEEQRLRERLLGTRRECALDLRESNRDTKLTVLLRCQRARLLQERTLLQKREQRLRETPGADTKVQQETLESADALGDALRAIIDAIDTGFFQTSAALDVSLERLLEQYRLPWWRALERWRADRVAAWMRLLLERIEQIRGGPSLSPEVGALLRDGLLCLEHDRISLASLSSENDYSKIKLVMSQYESSLPLCLSQLRGASRRSKGASSSSASSSESN